MTSLFTQIRTQAIKAQEILYEDEMVFIFLSKNPHTEGHTLIVPVSEVSRFENLDPLVFSHMATIAQKYAKVLEVVYSPERVGIAIDGFQVDHVHMHIMPIWKASGGVWSGQDVPEVEFEELARVGEKIKAALAQHFV
ncbi:MAG: hypothetical protein RIQ41_468 [Candidatus Parcubacteria bacterium]|jgi:histidine triad (HIT) family protein